MFGNSSEELEYLKQFQNKIQQGTLEVIEENEEGNDEENEKEPIKINISQKNKKCPKILTHGKRKDQECARNVSENEEYCKLHVSN